MDNKMSRIVRY